MAPGLEPPLTNDNIAKQIAEVAKSSGADSFRVRISRKDNSQQLMPKVIATFIGATAEHLSSPETWLGQLSGGGHYYLAVTHTSNPSQPFPALQVIMSGEARPVDTLADTRPTWRGPAELVYPARPESSDNDNSPTYVGGLSATGSPPRNGSPQGSALNPPTPSTPGDTAAFERMRIQQMQDDMARRERTATDERHRQEMDLIKRQNELELAKLRAEMITSQKPQGEDPMVRMLAIMREEAKQQREIEEGRRRDEQAREERRLEAESKAEARRLEMEQAREERRLEREREDRKEREAAQLRLEEKLALERKSADERLMQMLTDKRNATQEMMEMMTPLTNAMGQTMNLVVQSIHAMQELAPQSEGEPPIFKLVGKVVDGIQAAAAAAKMPPVRVAPSRQASRQGPTNSAPARPPAPPAAQATVDLPAPTPGFAEVQTPAKAPAKAPAMERLIAAIMRQEDPQKVARFFYANVNDPSIAVPLANNNMQIVPTFATPELLAWLKESEANQEYTRRVFEAVSKMGEAMGIAEPVVPDEGQDEEVEDEPEGWDGDGESMDGGEASFD